MPGISVNLGHNLYVPYPIDMPLEYEEIKSFLIKVIKGEIKPQKSQLGDVINQNLIKKVTKNIGELINGDTFSDVLSEGTDSVLLTFNSAIDTHEQDAFVTEFIDMKTRFKRMRNRSVRFFAIDINTNFGLVQSTGIGFLLYPAFEKKPKIFDGDLDFLSMAEFIQKNSETKFSLKEPFFNRKEKEGMEFSGGITQEGI